MDRPIKKAKKSNNIDNEVVKKVHTSPKGRRFYHANNDERTQRIYCCTGKDDTCTNAVVKGGLCVGCGATLPRCKGVAEGEPPCPNQAVMGGLCIGCGATLPRCKGVIKGGRPCRNQAIRGVFCRTHDPEPLVCTGVKRDGSPCTNRVVFGGLCDRHGRGRMKCPCGREPYTCRKCNPLGNMVNRIRVTLNRATRRYIQGKPLGKNQAWLGCPWNSFFIMFENYLSTAGMTWEDRGQGEGKWNYDHILAFFDKKNRAETEDEIYRRAHYTNIRPMWSDKNTSKGNR